MIRPRDHSSRLARGELADPVEAERLAAEHPEEHLRRREFLQRTAALAGYRVVRITYRRLVDEPGSVVADLAALLGSPN